MANFRAIDRHPFSQALLDYHSGRHDAAFTLRRDDGFHELVPVAPFFDTTCFPPLEIRALDECQGSVLDVGCAVGRHSLELARRGIEATSLDILPEMEGILKDRGLTDVVIADVLQFSGRRFDTLLMLMNGIGMTGGLEGLARFLEHAHDLVLPGGRIVCDSIDVGVTTRPQHVAYRERNLALGRPAGQQEFIMEREGVEPVPFRWLHIEFPSLARLCESSGWDPVLLEQENNGHYLCKLMKAPGRNDETLGHSARAS